MEIQRIAEENGKLKELLSQAPALLDELKELKAQNQLLRVQVMALESRRGGADGAGGGGGSSDASGGGPMYLS